MLCIRAGSPLASKAIIIAVMAICILFLPTSAHLSPAVKYENAAISIKAIAIVKKKINAQLIRPVTIL